MNSPRSNSLNHASLIVYFDGDCPLCRREIAFFRKREAPGRIHWINICDSSEDGLGANLSRCDAMKRFTVRKSDGSLLSGAPAFVEMWKLTPGFSWLGHLGQYKSIGIILEMLYRGFLKIRPQLQRLFKKA